VDFGQVIELLAERLGEPVDGELAAHMRAQPGRTHVGVDGGVVGQHAVALLAEAGQHRPGAVDVAEQVGLQHPPERVGRGRLQRAGQVDTGVLDPDIDAAEPLDRVGQFGHGRRVSHVGGHGQSRAAGRLAVPCQLLQAPARRAVSSTRDPRSANASLVARPIPLEAPVITTTAPSNFLPCFDHLPPMSQLPTGWPSAGQATTRQP
jgi:hypothetical protein